MLDIAVFSLLVFALAYPYLFQLKAAHERSGRDLVIVLDTSGSMGESGFDDSDKERRKFDVVESIVSDFISKRYDDNIGLVIFGTFAFTASPVTYDLNALKQILNMVDVGVAGQNTAIGEGIWQALRSLTFGSAKEKMIILLTDGRQNSGSVSVAAAVKEAAEKGVKIYTIGVGKEGEYDSELLKRVARESGGKSFCATDAKELESIYEEIDRLEPSPIRSDQITNRTPLYTTPLLLAMLLFGFKLSEGIFTRLKI
ncbi:MAG: VWA domain-containing protein [Hydrogenimonas sp.]|nr:VWA domain-containing protein [Hydrogenimonas sp.]